MFFENYFNLKKLNTINLRIRLIKKITKQDKEPQKNYTKKLLQFISQIIIVTVISSNFTSFGNVQFYKVTGLI